MKFCTLALVVGLTMAVGCGQKVALKPFNPPDGSFTVMMPGTPKEESSTEAGIKTTLYLSESKNIVYIVSSGDLPRGFPVNYPTALSAIAAARQGKITKESDFTLAGVKGKAYEMEMGQPKGVAIGRMVVVNNRLYQMLVLGESLRSGDAQAQQFMDSFALTK